MPRARSLRSLSRSGAICLEHCSLFSTSRSTGLRELRCLGAVGEIFASFSAFLLNIHLFRSYFIALSSFVDESSCNNNTLISKWPSVSFTIGDRTSWSGGASLFFGRLPRTQLAVVKGACVRLSVESPHLFRYAMRLSWNNVGGVRKAGDDNASSEASGVTLSALTEFDQERWIDSNVLVVRLRAARASVSS